MSDSRKNFSELAQRAAKGDERAYHELVLATTPTAYRLALRILGDPSEAQDVLQESYLRVWQKLPSLRNTDAVIGWVYRICRNAALDQRRFLGRRNALPLFVDTESRTHGPDVQVEMAQTLKTVQAGMGKLAEKHRLVLLMREVDGMSCDEIAEALGIKVGTVDSRLHRARKQMASYIQRAETRSDAPEIVHEV